MIPHGPRPLPFAQSYDNFIEVSWYLAGEYFAQQLFCSNYPEIYLTNRVKFPNGCHKTKCFCPTAYFCGSY